MDQSINDTVSVFCRLAKHNENRLRHGMDLRRAMHEAIQNHRRPSGYRPKWIQESSQVVIALLGEIASDFDQQHNDDKCSLQDLMDVAATAIGLLKKEIGEDED